MNDALEAKLKTYSENYFENKEFRAWLNNSNLWLSLYTCLRLRGVEMDKRELVDMLNGGIVQDLSISTYNFIHNFKAMFKDMQASVQMKDDLNEKLLFRFCKILFEEVEYRKTNPVIYKWGYIAPHFTEISNYLSEAFKTARTISNPTSKAYFIHNAICAAYPFAEDTAIAACIAMYYELLKAGIPLPSFSVDNEDYDKLMLEYFDQGLNNFETMFENSLLNRLDSVLLFGFESRER